MWNFLGLPDLENSLDRIAVCGWVRRMGMQMQDESKVFAVCTACVRAKNCRPEQDIHQLDSSPVGEAVVEQHTPST